MATNFWAVDGRLGAHTLVLTYKATQAFVLPTSQIHSWPAFSPSLASYLAAPVTSTVVLGTPALRQKNH